MTIESVKNIAANLKFLRHLFGYTQTEIANHLHISRSTYAFYESGERVPSAAVICDLSNLYDMKADAILRLDNSKQTKDFSYVDKCNKEVDTLVSMFYKLSPYGQGCLIERARTLVEHEGFGIMPNHLQNA